ncbi:Putative Mn2+ efflux pump MntP [Thermanaeromonas toyohensis ToBE]|uniref:Putative manganese efflux pump MntP n=1 Tax=Thermanaeromonas toyohensis ToBE TaxID=698762 RepID=A0A1W1W3A2_9FIRM|nr:manganese efflux pump [Thermanaeromonas toyohensis]SMC00112.1 Putative Mn2+ efflux pump MntP [Thermanaeromonas toyohensis ToBE]
MDSVAAVLLVAMALGTDAFSLAAGLGMAGLKGRSALFLSGLVGLLHVIMPLFGFSLGLMVGRILGRLAAVVGASVLTALGILMLSEVLGEKRLPGGPFGGVTQGVGAIFLLAGSVSLDSLTVGFGLGALQVNLSLTVFLMGLIAGTMTGLGFILGRRAGRRLGEKAEVLGGVILVVIGLKMLVG